MNEATNKAYEALADIRDKRAIPISQIKGKLATLLEISESNVYTKVIRMERPGCWEYLEIARHSTIKRYARELSQYLSFLGFTIEEAEEITSTLGTIRKELPPLFKLELRKVYGEKTENSLDSMESIGQFEW